MHYPARPSETDHCCDTHMLHVMKYKSVRRWRNAKPSVHSVITNNKQNHTGARPDKQRRNERGLEKTGKSQEDAQDISIN